MFIMPPRFPPSSSSLTDVERTGLLPKRHIRNCLVAGFVASALVACGESNVPDPIRPPSSSVDTGSESGGGLNTKPDPAVSVVSPASDMTYKAAPVSFDIGFDADEPAPETLNVSLNGHDVSELFIIGETGATASGNELAGYLREGRNKFKANGVSVSFVFDTKAPRPVITAVLANEGENCQLVHPGAEDDSDPTKPRPDISGFTHTVSGHLVDHSAVTAMSITVKDQAGTAIAYDESVLSLEDGQFSAEIPCGYSYEIATTDELDNSATVTIAAPGTNHDPSMAIQVNGTMFDFVLPIINDVMASVSESGIADPDTVIDLGDCLGLGYDCEMTLNELSLSDDPQVIFELKNDADVDLQSLIIRAGATLPVIDLAAKFTVKGVPLLGDVGADMDFHIEDMLVSLSPVLSTDDANYLQLTLADDAPLELSYGLFESSKLELDLGFFKPDLSALTTTIAAAVRSAISSTLSGLVVPVVKPLLEEFQIDNMPLNITMAWDGIERADMSIDVAPTVLDSVDGNALIELAGNIHANKLGESYRGALGSVFLDQPMPILAATTAAGKEYDLGIALPINLLNQAFLSLQQTGLTQDFSLPFIYQGLGEPLDATLASLGVVKGDILTFTLDMGAVPQMALEAGSLTDFILYLDRMSVKIAYQRKAEEDEDRGSFGDIAGNFLDPLINAPFIGGFVQGFVDNIVGEGVLDEPESYQLMTLTMDIVADLELGVNENNYLAIGVEKLISLKFVSLESDFLPPNLLPIEKLNQPLEDVLTTILAKGNVITGGIGKVTSDAVGQLVATVYGLELPIPLPDVGVILRQLEADENNAHLVLSLDLLSREDMDAAAQAGELLTFALLIDDPESAGSVELASVSADDELLRSAASIQKAGFEATATVPTVGQSATIALAALNPSPQAGGIQYRYRVDAGLWSIWKERDQIELYKMDRGQHVIEICGRTAMLVEAESCDVIVLNVAY
jgi:hypothetical protein